MAVAIIFSDTNIISFKLAEVLLKNSCQVFVVSNEFEDWNIQKKNKSLNIFSDERFLPDSANYVFFVSGIGFNPEKVYDEVIIEKQLRSSINYSIKNNSKLILVFPFTQEDGYQKLSYKIYQKNKNLIPQKSFIVFSGEVYGEKMHLLDGGVVVKLIKEIVFSSVAVLGVENQNVYFAADVDIANEIVKKTFSFGFSDKETVVANIDTLYNLFLRLQKIKPNITLIKENNEKVNYVNCQNIVSPQEKNSRSLRETIYYLSQYASAPVDIPKRTVDEPKPKVVEKIISSEMENKRESKKTFKRVRLFLFLSFALLIFLSALPFVTLALSMAGLKYSYSQIKDGNFSKVERLIDASTRLASFSKGGISTFSGVSLTSDFFNFPRQVSVILEMSGNTALNAIDVSKKVFNISESVLGGGESIEGNFESLTLDMQRLYQSTSILVSEIDKLSPKVKSWVPLEDIKVYRKYFLSATKITPRLTVLLGLDMPKTYLVLFQNNMELRPTGGFIGSFALVTMDQGKLSNIEVHDVYTADGQLRGHIEPPSPIKNYLGEANWYLRDSNWDPDFPSSARRAEWFLGKEIDRSVDGVIAVDLEVAKSLLLETGEVTLPDFNQTIDYKNMYERLQYEVESDFFPGSQKKKNILTALINALTARISETDSQKLYGFAKASLKNLNERHIQIYLKDPIAQEGIAFSGWDGAVKNQSCMKENCERVNILVAEANVGVNKANYFIKRNIKVDSILSGNKIKNILKVELANSAAPALGLSGRYKAYVRLITDSGSFIDPVEISDYSGKKTTDPEIFNLPYSKEAGVLVEIPPGQKKTITFRWNRESRLNIASPGTIELNVRKQAGILKDLINARILAPSLTGTREFSYNTDLSEDRLFKVDW